MKVHVIYTSPEVENENSEVICKDIVNDIADKMFMQDESATERKDGEEHNSNNTRKRKLNVDGNNTTAKRKLDEDGNNTTTKNQLVGDELDLKKEKVIKKEMNVDDEENNEEYENNTSDKFLNEQDANCSETLHYCAHCDYAAKTIFDIKDHIERKHAPEEVIICSNNNNNNEKSDIEFTPEEEEEIEPENENKIEVEKEKIGDEENNKENNKQVEMEKEMGEEAEMNEKEVENNNMLLYCCHCGYKHKSKSKVLEHIVLHHIKDGDTLCCSYCYYNNKNKTIVLEHMQHCKDREGYKSNSWDFEMEKYLRHKQMSSNRKSVFDYDSDY